MHYFQLQQELKQGGCQPLYLLYGTETLLMNRMVREMEQQIIPGEERDFNIQRYDCMQDSIQSILEDADTFPMLGERRFLHVSNALFFTAQHVTYKVEHNLEQLLQYLSQPAPFSIIVFTLPQVEKLDERKKIVKMFREKGSIVQFQPLKEAEISQWLKNEAEQYGKELRGDATEALMIACKNSLAQMEMEMEKLTLYTGERSYITGEDVRTLVPRSLESDVFALANHLFKREWEAVFRTYYDLLQFQESPLKLFALLARQVRLVLYAQGFMQQGYGERQIAQRLKLPTFVIRSLMQYARQYKEVELRQALIMIAQLDYEIKTGQTDEKLAIERFIFHFQEVS